MEQNAHKEVKDENQHEVNKPKKTGKGLIIALVIVIILAIAAIFGIWYFMDSKAKSEKKAQEEQIQQLQKQINDLNKQSSKVDETADWLTYNDVYDGLSFKYPKDWKLTTEDKTNDLKKYMPSWKGPFTWAYVTSPSGFKISLTNHISGIGGGCNPEECPQNQFISKEKILTLSNGQELYLVKYQLLDSSGKNLLARRMGYIGINPKAANQQSLENYQGFGAGFYFVSTGIDEALSSFEGPSSGEKTNYQTNLTAEQYFAQPDLQTAEKIFKSIKQI
jgi:type II secretory pathway pseudopilin PulG